MRKEFSNKFKKAYADLYKLHPQIGEQNPRFRYLRVDWFFPNHIHNVLEQVKDLGQKYFTSIDYEVCLYAGLLHDSGLVYKRETAEATGHEERSIEYAEKELKNLGYSQDFIIKVLECIRATNVGYDSKLPEAILVRNADAYAHLISMHFFAKANFANDIISFIDWFENKVERTYKKISIPELRLEIGPLVNYYQKMLENYRKQQISEKVYLNNITGK